VKYKLIINFTIFISAVRSYSFHNYLVTQHSIMKPVLL